MAVIRLELEVDSEVYPELHAVLAAVGRESSRGERLRQLAAAGLVWETVRVQGACASGSQGPSNGSGRESPRGAARVGARSQRAAERPAPRPGRSDSVDVALDALAPAVAGDAPHPARHGADFDAPTQPIPLLLDVVNPSPLRLRPHVPAREAPPPCADGIFDAPGSSVEEAGSATPCAGLVVHKTVVRSRLLRMKDKGLFKNG